MLTSGVFGYLLDYLLWWLLFLSLVIHTWCFFKYYPRARRPRFRLIAGNALVFVCLVGAVALAGESYFRFVCVRTDAFGVSLPARRWFALYTNLNSLGCRDREWRTEKAPGGRRIAFIGDSFAYGWGIEDVADRFTERLQARFDRDRPGAVEVMNVSKPGWGTDGQLPAIASMVDAYAADEIVLCYVPNDIERLIPVTPDFNPRQPPQPTLINPDSSCLVDYLYRQYVAPRAPTVVGYFDWLARGYDDPQIWRMHQEQLDTVVRLCREKNVELRVVLLPFLRTTGERFVAERIHEQVARFFREREVRVLDLGPLFAGQDSAHLVVHRADAHPNPEAHGLIADAVWEALYATK